MYYSCSDYKGTADLRLCFHICKTQVFSRCSSCNLWSVTDLILVTNIDLFSVTVCLPILFFDYLMLKTSHFMRELLSAYANTKAEISVVTLQLINAFAFNTLIVQSFFIPNQKAVQPSLLYPPQKRSFKGVYCFQPVRHSVIP